MKKLLFILAVVLMSVTSCDYPKSEEFKAERVRYEVYSEAASLLKADSTLNYVIVTSGEYEYTATIDENDVVSLENEWYIGYKTDMLLILFLGLIIGFFVGFAVFDY